MANLSKDIQCASSDTQPPMLDRTDFASWQQRIQLYCRGKENGVNIQKSIDEGPFQMRTFMETLAEGTDGAQHLDAKDIWDNVKMLLERSELTKEDRESQLYDDFEHFFDRIKVRGTMQGEHVQLVMGELRTELGMLIQAKQDKLSVTTAMENGVVLDEEQLLFITGGQDNVVDEDMDEPPVQDLALNVDNVFQTNDRDAFDSNVDEAPTTQTMFIANLSLAEPVYDEASLSYNSNTLSEVVQIVLWYLDSDYSKHMMENRLRLRNFVQKFTRTIRFRNDHFGGIMGYGDYVIGDSVISRVYYVKGLRHNLFSVGQFCN
ncbi:hypothetical protein Tco_1081996 [Tanacetum coccineum]|uniref:Retrovirus-related Pol polyprotein from transposon TNT 1-94-like beta-barrel domain-containing protein n=1 Tax=Tanacetum coccineum TaxID=301880 RepID=A0ABQ5HZ28_9ASTR